MCRCGLVPGEIDTCGMRRSKVYTDVVDTRLRLYMPEWFEFVLILPVWFALQRWILPRFGVAS